MNRVMDDEENTSLLEPREKPKTRQLIEMLETAVSTNGDHITRMHRAKEIRDCEWAGKSADGRKGLDEKDKPLGPWEGSSDVSVRLADMIVTEHCLGLMLGVLGSQLTATPQEMEDEGAASLAVSLLRYYFTGQMDLEVWTVLAQVVDAMGTYGHALVKVGWKETFGLVEREVTYDMLLDWAQKTGQSEAAEVLGSMVGEAQLEEAEMVELEQQILAAGEEARERMMLAFTDRKRVKALAGVLEAFDADMCRGEPMRLARGLQGAREAAFRYFAKERTESRPQWRMLLPWVDVFYSGLAEDFQDEPFVAEVEWVTEVQLRERAAVEEWDEGWVAKVLEHPGWAFGIGINRGREWILNGSEVNCRIPSALLNSKYFMLVRITYKAITQDGVTGVWETLVHSADPEGHAYHRQADVTDGQYPYVPFPAGVKRRLMDNRGVPEQVESEQEQLKGMTDARHDLTALSVAPPLKVHWKDFKRDPREGIKPNGFYPEREGVNTDFLRVGQPGAQGQGVNDETLLRGQVARRFGLIDDAVPPTLTQMHMQLRNGHFFKHLKVLIRKTFSLVQTHMDPLTGIRVAGGPEAFAAAKGTTVINVTREEIRGRYDFDLTYDPRDLNMEWVFERMKAVREMILSFDNTAAVDRVPILRMALSAIDSRLAASVKSADTAARDEQDAELNAWTVIACGEEPPMPENGVDFAGRYAVWQRMLSRSERAVGIIKSDALVLKLAQNRLKWLKQGMVQEQNKVTGRRGVGPTFDPLQNESLLGE